MMNKGDLVLPQNSGKVLHCQPLQDIINCAIASVRLTYIPVSVLLVSLSGAGKSLLLSAYKNVPGVHHTDSLSASGLYSICRDDPKNEIRHILVSDLNIPLSRKSSTVTMLIGTLIGLMTEGMVRVDDGRMEGKMIPHQPIGLLSAMTTEEFSRQAKLMHRVGLIRRLTPIFFEYKTSTEMDILRYYASAGPNVRAEIAIQLSRLRMKEGEIPVATSVIWPQSLKQSVIPVGQRLAENLRYMPSISKKGIRKVIQGPRIVPISPQQTIQKICEARALLAGRKEVAQSDMEFAEGICDFTQFGKPMLL
jgi:hypothetical protein